MGGVRRGGEGGGGWNREEKETGGREGGRAGEQQRDGTPEYGAEVDGDKSEAQEAPKTAEGCDLADRLDPDSGVEARLGRGQVGRLHLLRQGEGEEEHGNGADGAGGEDPAMDRQTKDGAVGHAHGKAVDDDA